MGEILNLILKILLISPKFPSGLVLFLRIRIVYDLRTQNLNFVAPIPEQIETTAMHFPELSLKGIVVVFNCSGMGATNLNSWGPTNLRL